MALNEEDYSAQYVNDSLVQETTKSAVNLLEKVINELKLDEQHKSMVLVLGESGVGKTTFTKWITGNDSNLTVVEVGHGEFLIDGDCRIGGPQTVVPEQVLDRESGIAFYDCPGFYDAKGLSCDLTRAYLTKKVADFAERIKMILLINFSSVRKGVDRVSFMRLMEHVTDLVTDINKFKNSIALAVTKVDYITVMRGQEVTCVDDESTIKNVATFLLDFKYELREKLRSSSHPKQINYLENAKKIVDILLTRDNGNFPRIGLFRRPLKLGPLDESILRNERQFIRDLIFQKLRFTISDSGDFGYCVCDRYKANSFHLLEQIHDKMEQVYDSKFSANVDSLPKIVSSSSIQPTHSFMKTIPENPQSSSGEIDNASDVHMDFPDTILNIHQPKRTTPEAATAPRTWCKKGSLESTTLLQGQDRESSTTVRRNQPFEVKHQKKSSHSRGGITPRETLKSSDESDRGEKILRQKGTSSNLSSRKELFTSREYIFSSDEEKKRPSGGRETTEKKSAKSERERTTKNTDSDGIKITENADAVAAETPIFDDKACVKCGKCDREEWMLLCDKCDSGYHTTCLYPPLSVIPKGEWYCQPCKLMFLSENLQKELHNLQMMLNPKENKGLRTDFGNTTLPSTSGFDARKTATVERQRITRRREEVDSSDENWGKKDEKRSAKSGVSYMEMSSDEDELLDASKAKRKKKRKKTSSYMCDIELSIKRKSAKRKSRKRKWLYSSSESENSKIQRGAKAARSNEKKYVKSCTEVNKNVFTKERRKGKGKSTPQKIPSKMKATTAWPLKEKREKEDEDDDDEDDYNVDSDEDDEDSEVVQDKYDEYSKEDEDEDDEEEEEDDAEDKRRRKIKKMAKGFLQRKFM